MASLAQEIKITVDNEVVAKIEKIGKDMREAKEALSEERIRAIVREEIAAWWYSQAQDMQDSHTPDMYIFRPESRIAR